MAKLGRPRKPRTIELEYSPAQNHMFFESARSGRFRIFPKGRRAGATRGGAQATVEWMLDGKHILWGDTVHGNIKRYYDRYFAPIGQQVKKAGIRWDFNRTDLILRVGEGYCDFRSADKPENWEGFGYDVILLNEAGIILGGERGRYLYQSAVLPMLIDSAGSQLIAVGTPKGRNLFYDLAKRALAGEPGYHTRTFTTYDNPWLDPVGIQTIVDEVPAPVRPQEIGGKFISRIHGSLFQEPVRYDSPNMQNSRIIVAMDTASSKRDTADYSSVVVLARAGDEADVLEVLHGRWDIFQLASQVKDVQSRYGATVTIEKTSQSLPILQYLEQQNVRLSPVSPIGDKYTRAVPIAAQWNRGKIRLPIDAPWMGDFLAEVLSFTGTTADDHDDQVDALVYAAVAGGITSESGCWHDLALEAASAPKPSSGADGDQQDRHAAMDAAELCSAGEGGIRAQSSCVCVYPLGCFGRGRHSMAVVDSAQRQDPPDAR